MIDMIAFALFTVAGLFSNGQSVQIPDRQAHYETVQYSAPPVPVMETRLVNGVNYPVDYYYHIWGTNAAGGVGDHWRHQPHAQRSGCDWVWPNISGPLPIEPDEGSAESLGSVKGLGIVA